jgi:hypothetical protein
VSDIDLFQQALRATGSASSGGRNAALFLHALAPNDRHWVMSQLESTQRAEMEVLLGELTLAGLPADRAIVGAALLLPAGAEVGSVGSPAGREAALSVLPAETVCHVLGGEPDQLIATLLRWQHWPWQESLLVHVGALRRHRILSALRGPAGSGWSLRRARFDEALMQGILARAARTAAMESVEPTASRFRALAAYVQRCIRLAAARIAVRAPS